MNRPVDRMRAVHPADTAVRLAKYFGGDAASWLVLQANFDLKTLSSRADIERSVRARDSMAA